MTFGDVIGSSSRNKEHARRNQEYKVKKVSYYLYSNFDFISSHYRIDILFYFDTVLFSNRLLHFTVTFDS